jgi:hypothetical protein
MRSWLDGEEEEENSRVCMYKQAWMYIIEAHNKKSILISYLLMSSAIIVFSRMLLHIYSFKVRIDPQDTVDSTVEFLSLKRLLSECRRSDYAANGDYRLYSMFTFWNDETMDNVHISRNTIY